MTDTLPHLKLPLLLPSQAQKHVTHNEALRVLDAIVHLSVVSATTSTPPLPNEGDRFIVPAGASGAWLNHDQDVAIGTGSSWHFETPQVGWIAFNQADSQLLCFFSGSWQSLPLPTNLDNLQGLGINASSDTTNRLSINSDASLFNHAGAGHQLKLNKATAGDTGSILFQSNWTGHAEIGLSGSTDVSLKVSTDGTSWTDALIVDAATGTISGAAIQQNATDQTAGRLMRADLGYSPANIVGTVSEAAGTPTGAVVESGTNANGTYTRWADGTQICQMHIGVDVTDSTVQDFSFPIAFVGAAGDITVSVGHKTADPHVSLRLNNIAGVTGSGAIASIKLASTGTSVDPASDAEHLSITAIGRWFN